MRATMGMGLTFNRIPGRQTGASLKGHVMGADVLLHRFIFRTP